MPLTFCSRCTRKKLDTAEKADLEGLIAEAKTDLESDDIARIDAGHQRLEAGLHKLAEALYKQEGPEGTAPGADASSGPADDDVIDADYTEGPAEGAGEEKADS